jgi:phosphoribosylformimino-5-aminoimidazole carboxamide ribotide isomerase
MMIYPAIDIRQGRCVQLTQGLPETEVVYSDDPASQAVRWVSEGARRLHVVNLDGTLSYQAADAASAGLAALSENLLQVKAIRAAVTVPIQFAGGLRSASDLEVAAKLQVERLVIGTAAIADRGLVSWALQRWGRDRIVVAIEVRDGSVLSHGWQKSTGLEPIEFGREMYALGVRTVLYTDVAREGLLAGVNVTGALELAEATGLRVIVSGGVGGADDIRELVHQAHRGLQGVVIGQALYNGRLQLADAIRIAGEGPDESR